MVWTFSGNLKQGPLASQYPNLHRTCVEDVDDDDPIWEQFNKAANEHSHPLETLRTASADTATRLLRSSVYQGAFGDLAYAVHCIGANIAGCFDGDANADEMRQADQAEVAKVREMQRDCSTFVSLVQERFNKEENGEDVRDWVTSVIQCITRISLQVIGLFNRLREHNQGMVDGMKKLTSSSVALAEALNEALLVPVTATAT